MTIEELTTKIKQEARRLGFDAAGITRVEPMPDEAQRYLRWLAEGMAADLEYLRRRPALRARPNELAPHAGSLISLAVNYYSGEFEEVGPGQGRIARYAWGRDYHEIIPPKLWHLVACIETLVGRAVNARCFVDAVPLLERAVARRAGVGRIGLNSCLITDRFGSWVFLSEILVDVELAPDQEDRRTCLSTLDCLKLCPTGAIPRPYVLDARRCISYHTIENRGAIERPMRPLMGDWLFGCDVCQEVCPHNERLPLTSWAEFRPEAGIGKTLSIIDVLGIASDEAFRQHFRGTALLRAKRRGLVRNAAVVAANKKYEPATPLLEHLVVSDVDAIVRGHAVWALSQFPSERTRRILDRASKDDDGFVREEAAAALVNCE